MVQPEYTVQHELWNAPSQEELQRNFGFLLKSLNHIDTDNLRTKELHYTGFS